jgi:hypothetical protein
MSIPAAMSIAGCLMLMSAHGCSTKREKVIGGAPAPFPSDSAAEPEDAAADAVGAMSAESYEELIAADRTDHAAASVPADGTAATGEPEPSSPAGDPAPPIEISRESAIPRSEIGVAISREDGMAAAAVMASAEAEAIPPPLAAGSPDRSPEAASSPNPMPSDPQPTQIPVHWNSWAELRGNPDAPLMFLLPNRDYDLRLDLSAIAYQLLGRSGRSKPTSPDTLRFILESTQSTVTINVLLLTDLEYFRKPTEAQRMRSVEISVDAIKAYVASAAPPAEVFAASPSDVLAAPPLGGHLKSGHAWTGQNRPCSAPGTGVV